MPKYLGHRFRTSNEKQILIVTGGERKASVTVSFKLPFLKHKNHRNEQISHSLAKMKQERMRKKTLRGNSFLRMAEKSL